MRLRCIVAMLAMSAWTGAFAQRSETLLQQGWKFYKGECGGAAEVAFDDNNWDRVTVPHDWAIKGPFSRDNDLQVTAITQNGEESAVEHTARSAGLPYMGVGWYRTRFKSPFSGRTTLVFDGAMSEARVYVNGKEAIFWPFGYNSFHVDVTSLLNAGGEDNVLAVRLQNRTRSSRWYPGAGLYRNVRLVNTDNTHVEVWGTQVTTPHVEKAYATVTVKTRVVHKEGIPLRIVTRITDGSGREVAQKDQTMTLHHGATFDQHLNVGNPRLWSPEHPHLYTASSRLYVDGRQVDEYQTVFGIRTVEFVPDKGFFLNGKLRKFQGVCLHHDLGPLGAAVNENAIRHQLAMLKDMGCDAIRTSHNMPAPELVKLCDEMGFMMMLEPFDEWDVAKCDSGYHRFFNEWAERDMVNMLRQYRNHPSVVMWSIGNEVPTQGSPGGYKVASMLQDICHREDPTRLCTCGMDQVATVLANGFAALIDVPGFNYRTFMYEEAYSKLPQNMVLGSETSSVTSSRGVYTFPLKVGLPQLRADHQATSYDVESGGWCNTPDVDFALAEDHHWTLGQFVWTGFDYLGEPYPYDTDGWPSHSSYFGIIDLASIPKDRYYLYRSMWNRREATLHILPHWTWPGREGEVTPVMVYTDSPEAELFVNGKSQGRVRKLTREESLKRKEEGDALWLQRRYRLIWDNVTYEPGELKVVAYGTDGKERGEEAVRTAGNPHHLLMECDRQTLAADGRDLAYVTVSVVDKDGNLCPHADNLVELSVEGCGTFRAAANGDAANLDLFHLPRHHFFGGRMTAIVQSGTAAGGVTLTAKSGNMKSSIQWMCR